MRKVKIYSYSIKNSKKTESEWEATENLSDNILKYYEDFNEVAIVFQGCAWAVANQINPTSRSIRCRKSSPQNEAIPNANSCHLQWKIQKQRDIFKFEMEILQLTFSHGNLSILYNHNKKGIKIW
ncbi:hypothetical protein Avbf_16898 [Armadillidium vulgare]|nr:hypothetical protein Avbf_16898 [Armadillidium vulgare]